ncbi:hypothetical protein NO263_02365 [Gluconacetobacter entanii]|uniref:Abortive infection protein-like C-terminal domain-containing protein n=1 Tax=Gluconacetobacter entanii TaxID=108528 RepID=A0ABT3K1Z6_9PROT|nr:hypothetical protein [Gluconacetobacter entanii]MCW4589430.1 hypothetical protein [Gluconacetobacter entanii]MCW4593151.1 hypothetical protein [Gluconacetobacter entanii]NPC88127.1 hypothetical protein [Gluconacetobacter entanii]
MPRVVPSQIVTFINQSSAKRIDVSKDVYHKGQKEAAELSTISSLLSQIPPELIRVDQSEYCLLVLADAAIKNYVERLKRGILQGLRYPEINNKNCAIVILDILKKCPDATPVPSTTELTFIDDERLAASIRLDLSSAASALHNAEWKASTVLAGSVCEALLLWAILRAPNLTALTNRPTRAPDRWSIEDYKKIAVELRLIAEGTGHLVDQTKQFRNLIHPGCAYRQNESCDRATALTALSAAECIVRDIYVSINEGRINTAHALPEDCSDM